MNASQARPLILFSGLAVLVALVFVWLGAAYGVRMLVEASCYALIALGLTIQWGYAGLFNAGVMGFIAIAAFVSMIVSYPVNDLFWDEQGAGHAWLDGAVPRHRRLHRHLPASARRTASGCRKSSARC